MSYTVLARKYRSATFDDVVGQDHVAQTLKRAIESGRISHAFLFCGTRGTGKTSMARILAKSLNCQKSKGPTTTPCLECDSCKSIARGEDIDVLEIDAASNTQVDKTREVILDNAAYRPARSRFKVYIIDEVHMLSKASFNALLKTLEEPPEHVKFILATTEPEKVLPTIQSRCQRYDFRNIPTREIAAHLADICKREGIDADPDAVLLVAKAGSGSMRDALSVLDRLLSMGQKKLDVALIEQLLGLPRAQLMFDLSDAIGRGDARAVLEQAADMVARGMSADSLLASLSEHLRNLLIVRTCGIDSQLVEVPGLSPRQLAEQAARFDPVNLTQDITILEELRRTLRQSQAGRALLDATLVRLALAEQFMPIGQALASVSSEAQKKNAPDLPRPAPEAVAEIEQQAPRPAISTLAPEESGLSPQPAIGDLQSEISLPAPQDSGLRTQDFPTPQDSGLSPPLVSAPPSLDFDDEDDDLPRPGKVWDDSGPSLSDLLARQTATVASPSPDRGAPPATPAPDPDPQFQNVEPVVALDLSDAWRALLDQIKDQPGMIGLLANASLDRVDDQQAVVRISGSFAAMMQMFDKNGRREKLCDHLSGILGRRVGVKFEVDQSDEPPSPASPGAGAVPVPAAPPRSAPPSAGRPLPRPQPSARPATAPEPAPPTGIRITPDLVEQMRREEFLAMIMDEFNATPVKVE